MSVIYKAQYFQASYDTLEQRYPDINWVRETNFKEDTMTLIEQSDDWVGLFVDDDIVFREVPLWELNEMREDALDIISLRLGKNIVYDKHFHYKGSLDGNIYRRELLLPLWHLPFNNPNKLESKLTVNINGTMGWFNKSRLIGIPANKVSDTSTCSAMSVGIASLNALFEMGLEIDYKCMDLECNNVHKYEAYKFKYRC